MQRETVFEKGFPSRFQTAVRNVIETINTAAYDNGLGDFTDEGCDEEYFLADGSVISFPYRIYFPDDDHVYGTLSSKEERLIYDCIFTRSYDGYVREKHLKNILAEGLPEWCMPYVLKLSSEYIREILEDIYIFMAGQDNHLFQSFCEMNAGLFKTAYNRMISYWNEYYRKDCGRLADYIGYKLYKQCFSAKRRT